MPKSPSKRKRVYKFSLWQDGLKVASVESADLTKATSEIHHYFQMYRQDGEVILKDDTKYSGKKKGA